MSFFTQIRTQDQSAPVTLFLNEDTLQLQPDQYRGKTVSQLFAEYGASLGGDVARINRYVLNGEAVAGDTVVRPGESVRGSVSSESKGLI
jgi:hypothetical protein